MSSSSRIDSPAVTAVESESSGVGEIMLFGVRVVVDSMRKSVSLNNLSQYEQPHETAKNGAGGGTPVKDDVAPPPPPPLVYASENDAIHNSGGNRERERKRGIPWTEDEHKLFLLGLQKVGKGDWRGISRNFVKTRTPTQVASHAQKYFLRRNNHNRRRRRSSLFDITTDTVSATPMEEEQVNSHHQDDSSQSQNIIPFEPCNPSFSLVSASPMTVDIPTESLTFGHKNPANNNNKKTILTDLNLNLKLNFDSSHLSLKLSLPSDHHESSSSSSSSSHSAFQTIPGFNNGDKIISVA